jgi:hypothetical protein
VVRVPISGVLRLSEPLVRAVYCVGGCGGAFARKISATLLLPEQAASRAPKIDKTIMRIMTSGLAECLFLTAEVGCERECHLIGL